MPAALKEGGSVAIVWSDYRACFTPVQARFPQGSAPPFEGKTWNEALEKARCQNVSEGGPSTNEMPMTPNNQPRYVTRTGMIRTRLNTRDFTLKAGQCQDAKIGATDVLDRAAWFETEISDVKYLKSNFD